MANKINKLDWTVNQLYEGCMLASIAHAIMMAHYPSLSYHHSWEGNSYRVMNSSGVMGTIIFSENYCIAAFRYDSSDRARSGEFKKAVKYFAGAPKKVVEIAKEEIFDDFLEDVLYDDRDDDEECMAYDVPVITTAFWGENNELFSLDTVVEIMENCSYIIKKHIMDFDSAIDEWTASYRMLPSQVELMKSIFKRKISSPDSHIVLTKEELDMIKFDEDDVNYEIGKEESRKAFEKINISWEE